MNTDGPLVMTLLVRDEEDIVAQNIAFHLAAGVDHFIVTDNLSTDSTPAILGQFARQGVATVIHEPSDTYDQAVWVTRMARLACTEFGASWVIHSDADEFWVAESGSLREYFRRLPADVNVAVAPRHDFAFPLEDERPWHRAMIYRKLHSLNHIGLPLPPKVAHRAHPRARVAQGNHEVHDIGTRKQVTEGLEILHFPVRSRRQFERKIANGGAAYARNRTVPVGVGRGWRRLYARLRTEGSLAAYLQEYGFTAQRIRDGLRDGTLVVDRRVADFVESSASPFACSPDPRTQRVG